MVALALDPALDALKGWARVIKEDIKDPVPEEIFFWTLEAMCDGDLAVYATIALISFDTYCRPSESLGLHAADINRPRPGAGKGYNKWVVHFAPADRGLYTKTRHQDDSVLLGIGNRSFVLRVTAALLRARPRGALFGDCSLAAYERAFAVAAAARHLEKLRITPHSARHSGPSNDMLHDRTDLQAVQKRGRWECLQSVRRYEKNANTLATNSIVFRYSVGRSSWISGKIREQTVDVLGERPEMIQSSSTTPATRH